jgi:hypothetical protein
MSSVLLSLNDLYELSTSDVPRLVQREIKYTLGFYYVYCYKLLRKDMDVNE